MLASAPQPAKAQVGTLGVSVQNFSSSEPVSARSQMILENRPQRQGLAFAPRDIRINSILPHMPVNNVRISAPVKQSNLSQPNVRTVMLSNANQPHLRNPDFNISDIRISSPIVSDLDPTPISAPAPLPGLNQPQATVRRFGNNVDASAVYDGTKINFAPGVDEDLVTVLTSESIINWTTNVSGAKGSEVDFLPAGRRLRFTSDGSDYTVLNRIFTPGFDSAIRIDGIVTSDIGGTRGGNVWFYSPGGIVAGANSVFDVGSLILTTNDIDTNGGLFGQGGEIRFRQAAAGTGSIIPTVQILEGAQINAINEGSYLAAVAPRVEQAGQVNVNGSVAYVASENADLTISNGLFDISIPVGSGTTDANGIVHSGTTTGAASTDNKTDAQAIYMVAIPKNAALTMLVGGNIGYQPAVSASVSNGHIVLSAGHNVGREGSAAPAPEFAAAPVNSHAGNIEFNAGNYSSGVSAALNGALATNGAGILDFAGDLSLVSSNDLMLTFDGADQLAVEGGFGIFSAGSVTTSRSTIGRGGFNAPQNTSGMDIVSSGNIVINAVRIDVGDLTAGGIIDLRSQQDTNFGVGLAETGFTVIAGTNLAFSEANTRSGSIVINADNINGGSIRGGLDGSDAGNDFITVDATGNVALTGTVGSLDNTRIIVGGDLNIATIQNTDEVFLSSVGDAVVDTLNTSLGSVVINNSTSVTLNSGNINANLTLNATTIDGAGNDSISVGGLATFTATGDINFDSFTAGTGFNIRSATGNVNFTSANTQSGSIVIIADNINGGSIRGGLDGNDAGNDFITVDATGNVALTGTVGSLDGTRIIVGGDLNIATIQNTDVVFLSAGGDVVVDTLNTSLGSATLAGTAVTLNNGDVNANLTLNATTINVADNDTIAVSGFTDLNATGDISIGSIAAGTGIDIDTSGNVTFVGTDTQSGNITIDANNVTGGSILGGLDGSDAGNDFIVVNAGGNVEFTGNVGSLDNTSITAGGDLNIGTIQNTDNVLLTAGGAVAVDTLNTTVGSATVNGASVTLNNGAINTDLTLNATAGDVAGNGVITLGGFANFDATGVIGFGSITAGTGFDIDVAGDVTFVEANTRSGDINIDANNITGGSVVGGLDGSDGGNDFITLNAAGDVTLSGTVGSLDNTTITAGADLDIGTVQNSDAVFLTAAGTAVVDTLNATVGSATVTGTSVTLNNGDINANLTLNATAGNIAGNGIITLGGFANFDATGDIGFGEITAGTGFDIDIAGNVTFVEANTRTGDIAIDANNITGGSVRGGLDGSDGGNDFVTINAAGNVALTGTVGSLDNTTITAGGDLDIGTVQNFDAVLLNAGGAAVVDTLNTTVGSATINAASVTLNNGAINANLTLNATAGDVAGNGIITLGGFANFDATGDIGFGAITAGTGFDIDIAGNVTFVEANTRAGDITIDANNITGGSARGGLDGSDAGNDFVAINGAGNVALTGTVGSLDNTTITAGGDLDIGTVQNFDAVLLNAGGAAVVDTLNATVGPATINGTSVTLNNGAVNANLTLNATAGNIAGNGIITLGGFANFDATGDIGFGAITAGTGFDIDIAGNVTFVEANTRSGDINIDANNITGGSVIGGLDNSDSGNDFITLNATGNVALTGTVGSLDNTTITAGGNLNIGTVQNSDAVFLTAAGTAVVDTLNATVGPATINGTSVTLNNGAVNANLTLNATAGNIAGNGIITLGGFANFDATGDIGFGAITAGTGFDIDIAGNVTFVEANTRSGDINIDANNITGGSVIGGLDNSDSGNDFITLNATGNVALTGTVGSLDNTTITAGGNLNIGTVQNSDAVFLTAAGTAVVDTLNATVGPATINGTSVTLNNGAVNANLTLNATAGDVAGNGTINTGGLSDFDATGSIDIGNVTSSTVDFDAGQNIFFDSITSPSAISLTASNGTIGRGTGAGNITSGAAINVNGAATNLGTLDAATTIIVAAAGAAIVDNAISNTTTNISGGSVTLNNGMIGTDLTLNATGGDINGNGIVTVAGTIDLDATGNIGFGELDAQGGNFTVNANGDIMFTTARASGDLTFVAGGNIDGNSVVSGSTTGNVDLSGDQGIRVASLSGSTANLDSNAGDITINTDLMVTNGVTANANNIFLRGSGDLEVTATANTGNIDVEIQGDLSILQATAATNMIFSSLAGSVVVGSTGSSQPIMSNNGSIAINAESNATIVNETQAADGLIIVAGGLIDIQALASGATIFANSADVNIANSGQLGEFQIRIW